METASLTKPRISNLLSLNEWGKSPSSTDRIPHEDWKTFRLATDPRGWQAHARGMAFTNLRSIPPLAQRTLTLNIEDVSGVALTNLLRPPPALDSLVTIDRVVADASWMVESGEWDWEDGDSYDRRTLERVRSLLKILAFIARDTFDYHLEAPHPAPADEGSIDVFFEGAERNLLINTPQGDELVTYSEVTDLEPRAVVVFQGEQITAI